MNYVICLKNVKLVKHEIKGWCVIASKNFAKDQLITTNPVTLIGFNDLQSGSTFNEYRIRWDDKSYCIAFGEINLLNHSEKPNVRLERDFKNNTILAYALIDILQETELVIYYECALWFKPI